MLCFYTGITGIHVAHSCGEHKDVCTTKVCKQTGKTIELEIWEIQFHIVYYHSMAFIRFNNIPLLSLIR